MKRLFFLLASLPAMLAAMAQAPDQINYQGIARNPGGNVFPNQSMTLRLTIHDGSAAGPVAYRETRNVTTNSFGLFYVAIGSAGATSVTGSIATVNWSAGSKFLQVEMDPNGGSSFINMGTSQLLSVPYALYAKGAAPVGAAGGDLTGSYPNPTVRGIRGVNVSTVAPALNNLLGFDGSSWTPMSLATHPDNYWRMNGSHIYNANAGNVGIGTNTPVQKLDVNGNLQTLGFIMPTGSGAGKFLMSDASGVASWSSSIAATSIVLPYKDSASSETDHIFEIIQISPTSATGALYGVTRSTGANAFATGGEVSATNPGAFSAGVRGINNGTGGNGIGVFGSQNGNGIGVFGVTPSGIGVRGNSGTYSGVFGQSASGAGYIAGVFGYATSNGGNGTFGYGIQDLGFGALGISDKSTGVYGLTNAATYEASLNDGVGVSALASRAGIALYANSSMNHAGRFENTNPSNTADLVRGTTNGLGRAVYLQNTNASSTANTMEIISNGDASAIFAHSDLHGAVNSGVIHALTTIYGGNAIHGRANRDLGWGVYGLSDSSVGVGGIGYRNMSVGVYGQGWQGKAGKFLIDNSIIGNNNNVVEVSTTQGGNGIVVTQNNSANGVEIQQDGNGLALFANSNTGRTARIENTNAANNNTTLEVVTNGQGRAISARSNMPGPVNAGVVDVLTQQPGGNGVYTRATRTTGWAVAALADTAVAVGGVAYREMSVGILGQGWEGTPGRFLIDNTFTNNNNVLELSTTQGGNGATVNLSNSARGVEVIQGGNGTGVYARSQMGVGAHFENSNAVNNSPVISSSTNSSGVVMNAMINNPASANHVIFSQTNGAGNAFRGQSANGHGIVGISTNGGYGSGGVYGYNTDIGGNGLVGWGTAVDDWGILAHSDVSIGVYGESGNNNAGYFINGITSAVPSIYSQTNGLSNAASFLVNNVNNTADAVTINRVGAGRSLYVDGAAFNNPFNFYNAPGGKATARFEGRSGLPVLGHSIGTFDHGGFRIGVGIYGLADSAGSNFNYGVVGAGKGSVGENAGVVGFIDDGATGAGINAAVFGLDKSISESGTNRFAGFFGGDVAVTGTLSKGGGSFKIDHPQDPENKYLIHSFVESPDMMNVYNGNITTDATGKAIVDLPKYFEAENVDFKYQLTVIGQFSQAIIGEEIKSNQFIILTDKPNVKVSWQVTGVRNDKWAQKNRIVPEPDKKGNEKGKYLYPELYGKSGDQGIYNHNSFGPANGRTVTNTKAAPVKDEPMQQLNASVDNKRKQLNQQPVPAPELQPIKAEEQAAAKTDSQSGKMKQLSQTVPQVSSEKETPKATEKTKEPAEAAKSKRLSETAGQVEDVKEVKQPVQKNGEETDKTKQLQEKKKLTTKDDKLSDQQGKKQ